MKGAYHGVIENAMKSEAPRTKPRGILAKESKNSPLVEKRDALLW
jgi:hypothetical protein